MAATAHGSADPSPRSAVGARRASEPVAVAGVPQRWQNLAPGVNVVWQAEHCAPASGAPQLEQYLPVAGDWQAGQVGAVIGEVEAGPVMRE